MASVPLFDRLGLFALFFERDDPRWLADGDGGFWVHLGGDTGRQIQVRDA